MDTSIAPISSVPASSAPIAVAIDTALQAQVNTAQVANIDKLFGSLGLGGNTNTSA